jgi:hypothetical protein
MIVTICAARSTVEVVPLPSHLTRGLLEARLPGTDLAATADPLLRSLLNSGEVRNYLVQDSQGDGPWVSGAVEITEKPYRVVRADGAVSARRFALGLPVEGVHWGTQLGAIAGTNSIFLRETDAVARAAISVCFPSVDREETFA